MKSHEKRHQVVKSDGNYRFCFESDCSLTKINKKLEIA